MRDQGRYHGLEKVYKRQDVTLVVLAVAQGVDGGLRHMRAAPVEVLVDAPLHEARQLLASVGEVEPGAAPEGLGQRIEPWRDGRDRLDTDGSPPCPAPPASAA